MKDVIRVIEQQDIEQSIPARFENIVRLYPEQVAVKAGTRVVSYAELNAMANRVAHSIVARWGTEPKPVALLIEKGVEQIAAMLGILKAGKFFVLVDPSYPLERVSSVIQDSEAALLIFDRRRVSIAQQIAAPGCQRTRFDAMLQGNRAEDLRVSIPPQKIACVVYTSGSTGKPKGIIRDHRTLLHWTMTRTHECEASHNDRIAMFSSQTGNAVDDIFLACLNGATLLPFDVRGNGIVRLGSWISTEGISICAISSPVFRRLCETVMSTHTFPHLRIIRLRSETVHVDDVTLFKKYFPPHCVLITGLNSSEVGHLTTYRVKHGSELVCNEVPVGYAVTDKEVFLIDDKGQKADFGQVGEITVRSRYLSLGYWGQPELTDAKFKTDPQDPTKRFYFTGDLGLMRPDGCLIYKGRKDFRVKIRGYGVELGDVETALLSYPEVSEAVVVTREDGSGETRLIAYYTSREGSQSVGELRKFIKDKLPDYMIPSVFVRLEVMPLTPNGKIDRRSLPDPKNSRPDLGTPIVLPRTPTEEKLCNIWCDVLGFDQIGIHDNFFDLGGHSLAASSLVSKISQEFQIDLELSILVKSPTIERLAKRIESEADKSQEWSYLVQLQPGNGHKPIFFFPGGIGGEQEFLVYARLARHVGSEYPFYGLKPRSAEGREPSQAGVVEIARDYLKEIRSFQSEGPYTIIGECSGGIIAYEIAQQLRRQGQEIALLVLMDTPRPEAFLELWRRLRRRLNRFLGLLGENYYVKRLSYHREQLYKLKGKEKLSYLVQKGSKAFSELPQVRRSLVSLDPGRELEYIQRSYSRAIYRYRPEAYFGRMILLVSEELYQSTPSLGWEGLVTGGMEIYKLPGNHISYIRDNVQFTANQLRDCLGKPLGQS